MHHRRLEPLAERQELFMGTCTAGAAQDRHAAVAIEQRRKPIEINGRRRHHRLRRQQTGVLSHPTQTVFWRGGLVN